MAEVVWLSDPSEASLRAALAVHAPDLADLPLRINPWYAGSDPDWWSASAVVDGRFVVKYAWSEGQAIRLWREGALLERLRQAEPELALPGLVVAASSPALVVTNLVEGEALSSEWVSSLGARDVAVVASQLGDFLARLHGLLAPSLLLADLPVVTPEAQAGTDRLRRRFPGLVDRRQGDLVLGWCDWVDEVLGAEPSVSEPVLVHGDLHGYNQVWDHGSSTLRAVVDFEEAGLHDRHFDFRYVLGNAASVEFAVAVVAAYERRTGLQLDVARIMAWHILTVLGDALWRTEADISLPGGGTASSWVDDLGDRFEALASSWV